MQNAFQTESNIRTRGQTDSRKQGTLGQQTRRIQMDRYSFFTCGLFCRRKLAKNDTGSLGLRITGRSLGWIPFFCGFGKSKKKNRNDGFIQVSTNGKRFQILSRSSCWGLFAGQLGFLSVVTGTDSSYCVASGSGCAFYSSVPRIERTWRWLIHLLLLFALLAGNDRNGTVFDRSFQKGNSGLQSNKRPGPFPTEGIRCF